MADTGANPVGIRQLYGSGFRGLSVAQRATPGATSSKPAPMASTTEAMRPVTEVEQAAAIGALGKPLQWWIVLVLALVLLMFVAKKLGEASDFANIRMSVYNIVIISFAAIIGIAFFKVVFTRFKIPGLSALVLAV